MRKTILFMFLLLVGMSTQCKSKKTSKDQSEGLKVAILGDSYSTFESYVVPDTNLVWYFSADSRSTRKDNDVKKVEQTWWWQVKETMGYKLERNNSYSGSTICYTGYRKEDYTLRSFVSRMTDLGEPDVILVCGGTNDSWANAPIGTYKYGDWTSKELFSFRPAMAKMCHGLRTHYPKARILFILNSELKESINESVRTICKHYDIPLLELHDIDKQAGHPSVAGMKAFAEQVVKELKKKK